MEQARAQQFAVNFALSLLTVGIAGGVGGAIARAAFADKQKTAQDAMKQVGQLLINTPVAKLREVFDPVKRLTVISLCP